MHRSIALVAVALSIGCGSADERTATHVATPDELRSALATAWPVYPPDPECPADQKLHVTCDSVPNEYLVHFVHAVSDASLYGATLTDLGIANEVHGSAYTAPWLYIGCTEDHARVIAEQSAVCYVSSNGIFYPL